jgi:thiamine biosynthesis lipoprotein
MMKECKEKGETRETGRRMMVENPLHRFGHEAMATTFEMVISGEEHCYARQVAMEVFKEIDRLDGILSRFNPCSEVSQINRLRPGESVRVGIDVFECLAIASRIYSESEGAFDVTVGSLVEIWRDEQGNPQNPSAEELAVACSRTGMERLLLSVQGRGIEGTESSGETAEDENARTGPLEFLVGVAEAPGSAGGVTVDLGGIGKGYALDRIVTILDDWGIRSALIHGGTSTALAIGSGGRAAGCPEGREGWPVGVGGVWGSVTGLKTILLKDAALSGSGTETKGSHILDPRTGGPAQGHPAAWAVCPTATEADALSTAFMVMSTDEVREYCASHANVSAFLPRPSGDGVDLVGKWENLEKMG